MSTQLITLFIIKTDYKPKILIIHHLNITATVD